MVLSGWYQSFIATQLVELGLSVPWSGHLGFMKTLRISKRFYWPRMYSEVKDCCKGCPECQLSVGRKPTLAPLVPIPAVNIPFERIGVDVVRPVERRTQFILVIMQPDTLRHIP